MHIIGALELTNFPPEILQRYGKHGNERKKGQLKRIVD